MNDVGIDEQIRCVAREIALRRNVYPRWVASGRMTQTKAYQEIAAMEEVLETLKLVKGENDQTIPRHD